MTKGTTLIDVLIGSALILIVFLGIFGLYELALKVSFQSQHRTVATGIANEYMERTRNLSYEDVGVTGGYPDGYFKSFESVIRNEHSYGVTVDVYYIADPADGIGYPEDLCPNDYKQVVVSVEWGGSFPGEVSMSTKVAPLSEAQECEIVGGILKVNVIDPFGQPVADAMVSINDINSSLSDLCITGTTGYCQLILPSSLDGQGENYLIEISKGGWNETRTFGSGEEYNGFVIANPFVPHATLFSGEIIELTFSIGESSAFRVHTRSFREPDLNLGLVEFTLRGSKIVGEDVDENQIFKYDRSHITDQEGEIFISQLEWDNYNFIVPGLTVREPEGAVDLPPGTEKEVFLYLDSDHSLAVNVSGSDDSLPLFSAEVRIFNEETEETLFTDEEGRVLFIPLNEGTYGLEVITEGYDPFEGEITVSGNVNYDVHLTLNPD